MSAQGSVADQDPYMDKGSDPESVWTLQYSLTKITITIISKFYIKKIYDGELIYPNPASFFLDGRIRIRIQVNTTRSRNPDPDYFAINPA